MQYDLENKTSWPNWRKKWAPTSLRSSISNNKKRSGKRRTTRLLRKRNAYTRRRWLWFSRRRCISKRRKEAKGSESSRILSTTKWEIWKRIWIRYGTPSWAAWKNKIPSSAARIWTPRDAGRRRSWRNVVKSCCNSATYWKTKRSSCKNSMRFFREFHSNARSLSVIAKKV